MIINKIQFVYLQLQQALSMLDRYNLSSWADYKDIVEAQKDVYRLRKEYVALMNNRA